VARETIGILVGGSARGPIGEQAAWAVDYLRTEGDTRSITDDINLPVLQVK